MLTLYFENSTFGVTMRWRVTENGPWTSLLGCTGTNQGLSQVK